MQQKNVPARNAMPLFPFTFVLLFALAGSSRGDELAIAGSATGDESGGEPALALTHDDPQLEWGPCPEFFGDKCHIAVLHGDPAKPNTDVFFRLEGGQPFPAHRHTSAERMVLVAGAMDVTYLGQEKTHLKPGMYAYGPAERVHYGRCISDEACVLFIAFEAPVDAMLLLSP